MKNVIYIYFFDKTLSHIDNILFLIVFIFF